MSDILDTTYQSIHPCSHDIKDFLLYYYYSSILFGIQENWKQMHFNLEQVISGMVETYFQRYFGNQGLPKRLLSFLFYLVCFVTGDCHWWFPDVPPPNKLTSLEYISVGEYAKLDEEGVIFLMISGNDSRGKRPICWWNRLVTNPLLVSVIFRRIIAFCSYRYHDIIKEKSALKLNKKLAIFY